MDGTSSSLPLRGSASHRLFMAVIDTVCGAIAVVHALTSALLASLPRGRSASHYLFIVVTEAVDAARAGTRYFDLASSSLLGEISDFNIAVAFIIFLLYLFLAGFFVIFGLILLAAAAIYVVAAAIYVAIAAPVALVADVAVAVSDTWRSLPHRAVAEPSSPAAITSSRPGAVEIPGDKRSGSILLLVVIILASFLASCSGRNRELGNRCSSDADCVSGLSCYNWNGFTGKKCVRTTIANPFNTVGTSLPFNKYVFLTTHNSFSITGVTRFTLYNQEDSVTDQLNNGVRALMLDVYDFRDDIWLCHSLGGKCFDLTAFEPAIYTMREIEAFLLTNPSEILTLILEDHVTSHHGLSKLFNKTGLMKYWFPVSRMPRDGEDWPRISDMIKLNHRLLVFTSNRSKESSEEIAYQWNYMVENQYGDGGMDSDVCYNRLESLVLSDTTKSLVLVNYFRTIPRQWTACMEHSHGLVDVLNTCYAAAGNRWANFLAVDYYKRSDGGGVFQATDMLNGMLICGRNDVRACRKRTLKGALYDLLDKLGLVWKASPIH